LCDHDVGLLALEDILFKIGDFEKIPFVSLLHCSHSHAIGHSSQQTIESFSIAIIDRSFRAVDYLVEAIQAR
jgi:hypothetical protein